jgi:coiled-coil domain-containing protein 130
MQGFNMGRYHPPASLDASLSTSGKNEGGFNSQGHPLGKRANKISSGVLVIRFEMPFAIWCTTCQPEQIIGQGVRFNAEKKKVGNYYSSPIYSFRMKHGACGGVIEIRTDPKSTQYVVHEGGRKKEEASSRLGEGVFGEILTEEERQRRKNDAFAQLEGSNKDKETAKKEGKRLEELMALQERDWKDPAATNAKLRKTFRIERKRLEANDRDREEIADRLGLNIHVLDESVEDRERAKLVEFGGATSDERGVVRMASTRALFEEKATLRDDKAVKTKAELKVEKRREALHKQLRGNTRAAIDPFNWTNSKPGRSGTSTPLIAGIKRKRTEGGDEELVSTAIETPPEAESVDTAQPTRTALVDYDSDD